MLRPSYGMGINHDTAPRPAFSDVWGTFFFLPSFQQSWKLLFDFWGVPRKKKNQTQNPPIISLLFIGGRVFHCSTLAFRLRKCHGDRHQPGWAQRPTSGAFGVRFSAGRACVFGSKVSVYREPRDAPPPRRKNKKKKTKRKRKQHMEVVCWFPFGTQKHGYLEGHGYKSQWGTQNGGLG